MAIYRQIQTTFWSDTFIESLTPEQKYFYIYLLTNDKTKQCGIYEISMRSISYETGYNNETVEKLLNFFQKAKKIRWSKETSEIALVNWSKYNNHGSPKVQLCINKELKLVKNKVLIGYVYGSDTISQEEQEQEQEQTDNNNDIPAKAEKPKSFKQYSEEDFKNEVATFKDLYPSEMLRKFYSYWIEKSPSGKMKFQLQKTWETNLRLVTWKNNNFDSGKTQPVPEKLKTTPTTRNIL